MSEQQPQTDLCNGVLKDYSPPVQDPRDRVPPRDVRCTLPAGHGEYHHGDDGMPFGPYRATEDRR